jgi:hypothetical protein
VKSSARKSTDAAAVSPPGTWTFRHDHRVFIGAFASSLAHRRGVKVSKLWGAVAQVDHDARAEIGGVHNRVLSAFEHLSRQISRSETGLRITAGTYATAPWNLGTTTPGVLPTRSGCHGPIARSRTPRVVHRGRTAHHRRCDRDASRGRDVLASTNATTTIRPVSESSEQRAASAAPALHWCHGALVGWACRRRCSSGANERRRSKARTFAHKDWGSASCRRVCHRRERL